MALPREDALTATGVSLPGANFRPFSYRRGMMA
jgi:hypothetical protein